MVLGELLDPVREAPMAAADVQGGEMLGRMAVYSASTEYTLLLPLHVHLLPTISTCAIRQLP